MVCYRSRLAGTSVSLPSVEGLEVERSRDVIPLLCSIFLANQGAGEAAGEEKVLTWVIKGKENVVKI
ncbi:hypothetical protein CsSME_00030515 [Camellia sinensis var. sinensis]